MRSKTYRNFKINQEVTRYTVGEINQHTIKDGKLMQEVKLTTIYDVHRKITNTCGLQVRCSWYSQVDRY